MTGYRLRRTLFAQRVKEEYEKGNLDWWNVEDWVTAFNGGRYDVTMDKEVCELLRWIKSGRAL